MSASLAALIPTRNRPDLAMNAVRSLKDQGVDIDLYVSDNSAAEGALRAFCEAEGVTYLRPPAELSMPEHWDWALRQALERSPATHFTLHYDRKFSKPGHWDRIRALADRRPDRLIAFPIDHSSRVPPPLRIWQAPWTGKLYEIETARVALLLATGRVVEAAHALPILSNCVVPRGALDAIAARFGDICNSTGPDSAFMCRFLALEDRYLFADRPTGIVYASERSNGMGYLSGKGGDFADFLDTFGDREWLGAAPLPGLNLGQNMLYHEYEIVRRETGDRLPPLDRAGVLAELGQALRWVDDPARRAALLERLRREGYDGPVPGRLPRRRVRSRIVQFLWRHRARRGWAPPHICGFAFRSDEAAIAAGLRFPRAAQADADHLALLRPAEIPEAP
ncbi:MAG: glycosyltransferase family 2 protein [Allosphingosinicella sp.]